MHHKPIELVDVANLYHFRKIMFNWFRKKKERGEKSPHATKHDDEIEEALWEIKEEYDFPTEEIINVVQSKRENFDYLHKATEKRNKSK